MAQPTLPRFAPPRSFYADLKARTTAYFEQNNKTPTGGAAIWTKAVILIGAFVFFYTSLVFFRPESNWLALFECLMLGGCIAAIGFNVMHDGSHGSFSTSKTLNGFAAFTLNMMGGSSFMWNAKHNVVHHTYTNIDGHDDDIDIRPFMRMTPEQPKHSLHKYQHFYFWFLYAMLYISWIFVMDYQKYFSKKIGDMPYKPMTTTDHIVFWGFKAINLVLYIGLPIYMVGFLPWLVGFAVTTMFAGLVTSLVFQLAHTVEDTAFPTPHAITNKLEDEWAIHQVRTTANFATDNRLISWLVGGLNFQVEHHLFPKISHVHYPAISQILQQVCAEHNVPYINYPKMRYAVASHVSFLRQMGRA